MSAEMLAGLCEHTITLSCLLACLLRVLGCRKTLGPKAYPHSVRVSPSAWPLDYSLLCSWHEEWAARLYGFVFKKSACTPAP